MLQKELETLEASKKSYEKFTSTDVNGAEMAACSICVVIHVVELGEKTCDAKYETLRRKFANILRYVDFWNCLALQFWIVDE